MNAQHSAVGRSRQLIAVLGGVVILGACAATRSGSVQSRHDASVLRAGTASSTAVVPAGELAVASSKSLLEALRQLRPEYLWRRNPSPMNPDGWYATVVVDGVVMGDVRDLQTIPAAHVREVRFLDAREALLRLGTGGEGGAILVSIGRR